MFLHTYLPARDIFTIGSLTIYWYGLFFVAAIIAGYWLTRYYWREQGKNITELDNLLFWLVVGGLIGARIVDVFWFEWWYFRDHLIDIYKLSQGGLSWHGALLGGGIVAWLWCKKRNLSWISIVSLFVPGLAIGQAIGRWGNYFNQELFGLPTSLPWSIPILFINRPVEFINAEYFHPAFLYESLALIILTVVLWRMRHTIAQIKLFGWYLVSTGSIRLVLEFLRIDVQDTFGGIRAGLVMSLVVLLIGVFAIIHRSLLRTT